MTDRVDIPGRYELKYWVPDDAMPNVLTFLGHFMRHDAHMPAGRPYKVTSLYFERRRAQVQLLLNPPSDTVERLRRELEIQELTASIDALTGGWFGEQLSASGLPSY